MSGEGDFPKLGFEVDTAGLAKAVDASKAAEASIGKLGDAVDALATKSKAAAEKQTAGTQATAAQGEAAKTTKAKLEELAGTVAGMAQRLRATGVINAAAGALAGGPSSLASSGGGVVSMLTSLATRLGPVGIAVGGITGLVVGGTAAFYKLNEVLAQSQDKSAQFSARLKNAYGDAAVVPGLLKGLQDIAKDTGLSFDSTADSFLRFARNRDAIGATRKEMLELTETVQKLGIVSGASGGEAASGLLQLSQALAAGRLNGDELRSIMENMPALAKAIADGLNITVGQLRSMGEAGQLTSDKVFKSILTALPKAREEYKNLPDTVERASQRMTDAWERMKARLGEKLDSSSFVRSVIDASRAAVEGIADALTPSSDADRLALRRRRDINPGRVAAVQGNGGNDNARALLAERVSNAALANQVAGFNESFSKQTAPIGIANSLLSQTDELSRKQKELKQTVDTVTNGLNALERGFHNLTPGEAAEKITYFKNQLAGAKFEITQATDALTKYRTESANIANDNARYGGGGGTSIGADVRQIQESSLRQGTGAVSTEDAISAVIQRRKQAIDNQIVSLNQQADAERRTAAAVGQGRQAEIEAEVSNRAIAFAYQEFGKVLDANDPKVRQYADAFKALTVASKDAALAQSLLAANDAGNVAGARLGAVNGGAYAVEAAAARARAANTNRQQPGVGDVELATFDKGRSEQAQTNIRNVRRELELLRQNSGAGPVASAANTFESNLKKELEDLPPTARKAYEEVARARQAATQSGSVADTVKSISDDTSDIQKQAEAYNLVGREQAVALELLKQEIELRKKGIPVAAIEAQRDALRSAIGAQVDQNVILDKQKEYAANYSRIWTTAAGGLKDGFIDAFDVMFDRTANKTEAFTNVFVGYMKKLSNSILNAALTPSTDALGKALSSGAQGIGSWVGSLFSGGTAAVASRDGNAFIGGNVVPFAMGGVNAGHSTGRVVNRPEIFPMANGGVGLRGEAGDEGIFPLKRTGDGKLGISASGVGGGATIIVNDNRSSSGSSPVEVNSQRGPDGKQLVSIMIRDEVKAGYRNGTYDSDQRANYGNARTIKRV